MLEPSLRYSDTLARMGAGADHESDYFGSKACHGDHGRWCTPRTCALADQCYSFLRLVYLPQPN